MMLRNGGTNKGMKRYITLAITLALVLALFIVPINISIGDKSSASITLGVGGDINDAIDSLGSSGGTIYLGDCEYTITEPIVIDTSNIHLVGEGVGVTILKLSNDADCNVIELVGTDIEDCSIENLEIDGNSQNNDIGTGIYINTPNTSSGCRHYFEGLFIHDCSDNGIEVPLTTPYVLVCNFRNIVTRHNLKNGYNIYGADHCFDNCSSSGDAQYGFYEVGGKTRMVNCRVDGAGWDTSGYYSGAYFGDQSWYAYVVNFVTNDCQRNGMTIRCNKSTFVNIDADKNGIETIGNYAGIVFHGSAADNKIIGGFSQNSHLVIQGWGIRFLPGAHDNYVYMVSLIDNIYGPIDSTTADLIANTIKDCPGVN